MLALGLHRRARRRTPRASRPAPGPSSTPACIDEARALRDRWDPSLPAFSAIGYREAWSVIDGEATVEAAIEADIERTIAFAKRQRTWFRGERSFAWLDATDVDPLAGGAGGRRGRSSTPRD